MDIIKALKLKEDLFALQGATDAEIAAAEANMGLTFSDEYIQYLKEFGVASADGHEFTGIISESRLNVVEVTKYEKQKNSNIPSDMYVIEDLGIDKVFVWQNSKGEVFQTVGDSMPEKIADSMVGYLNS